MIIITINKRLVHQNFLYTLSNLYNHLKYKTNYIYKYKYNLSIMFTNKSSQGIFNLNEFIFVYDT